MSRNPYYNGPPSDHFDGERFFVRGVTRDKTRGELWRWRTQGKRAPWPKRVINEHVDHPPARVPGDRLRVSFVGHASYLLQTQGINILVDPVWSARASPVQWAGPKRVNAPGIALENLPPVDLVLVTHNHYDHMDMATLSRLARDHAPRVIAPLGNDAIMRRADRHIAAEAYDWGARVAVSGGVAVNLTPAYHWSARWLTDRRMALWCAFVIETPAGAIYCIGDTAWGNGAIFSDVRMRFPDLRLAIIPIGAYEPRWFMREQHVDPEEAVRVFQICGARHALAHHWGTFQLTDEAIDEPPRRLREALRAEAIGEERFRVLRPGEAWEVPEEGG